MEPLHWPRYAPNEAEQAQFFWWCVCIFAYATLLSIFVDALRLVLMLPFYAFGLDLLRWCHRAASSRFYFPRLHLLWFPFTVAWAFGIVVPLIADAVQPPLWFGVVLLIAVWRMTRVSQKVREHYLDYCLEHPGLSQATREKWRQCREHNWNEVTPAYPSLDQQHFHDAVNSLRAGNKVGWLLLVTAVITGSVAMVLFGRLAGQPYRAQGEALAIGVLISGTCALALLIAWDGESLAVTWAAVWHAIQTWCHSPPTVSPGARAAWSERSRYGDAENRRAYLVWNVVLITLLVLSAVVYYPLWTGESTGPAPFRYPAVGSGLLSRLHVVRADPEIHVNIVVLYVVATVLAAPLFVGTGLLVLVGPTAKGGRELFEDDDALEHERIASPI